MTEVHPYRGAPKDIQYKTQHEFTFCAWCSFQTWSDGRAACGNRQAQPELYPHDPDFFFPCASVNTEGACEFFEPSLFTRFLRLAHLGRKPVYRTSTSTPHV